MNAWNQAWEKVVSSATLLQWSFPEAQSSWCFPKCLQARPSRWNSKWIPHLPRQWVSVSFFTSARNTPEVLLKVISRDKVTDICTFECLKSGGRATCTCVSGAKYLQESCICWKLGSVYESPYKQQTQTNWKLYFCAPCLFMLSRKWYPLYL